MKKTAHWMKAVLLVALMLVGTVVHAADLPLAAASPLTGVSFDDRPLLLPVQRNFQMAMLTAGSELGRSCGRMEAYGWRMGQAEQARVNQIFNNTVDRLRLLGYSITPQTLTSVSKDITLFTADRADKHAMFLWSAGELGLVLNVCETTAPTLAANRAGSLTPSVQVFSAPMDVVPSGVDAMQRGTRSEANFTPVGEWVGGYTCAQGYTGGTLIIDQLQGRDFEGVFKFYPTPKNPTEPPGSYTVYGQYDKDSKRVLINPGKWIKRPKDFYNTVIVGSFDPVRDSFSAYFQGVSGCTSFEATRTEAGTPMSVTKPHHKTKPVAKKKKKVVTKSVPIVPVAPASDLTAPAPAAADTAPVVAPAPTPEPAPAPASSASPPIPVTFAPDTVPAIPAVDTPQLQPPPAPQSAVAPAQAPTLPAEDKKNMGGGILLTPSTNGK